MAWGPLAWATERPARIALIIDDLGYRLPEGLRAVRLPGAVTYSFLPHTPHGPRLARAARERGREVLLHLPMESRAGKVLGPGGLTRDMDRPRVTATVRSALASLPAVDGVSNHMGSLLTRMPRHMQWLMEGLRDHGGLYFVDSRTSGASVARHMAARHGLPSTGRDVFLDHETDPGYIAGQLRALVALARRRGQALGIGHPYPETLAVLEAELPGILRSDVTLVPVSRLLDTVDPQPRRRHTWRLSWSLSPRDAKSSKPSPSSTCCAAPASRL